MPDVLPKIYSETVERNVRRRDNEHGAEQHEIHEVDHDQREECSVIAQIGLILRDHPAGKCEMECPSRTDDGIKHAAVRLDVVENAQDSINRDRQNAVEREKIGRERDPEIGSIGHNVAAVTSDPKMADAATH